MSEEEQRAFLEERARKEAEELAAAEAKARAENDTVRARLWRNVGPRCADLYVCFLQNSTHLRAVLTVAELRETGTSAQFRLRNALFGSARKMKRLVF